MGSTEVPCPECHVALVEHELRRMLPSELLDRLLERRLEKTVSALADLRACPTPNCPMRVEVVDRVRMRCPMCKKSSCLQCSAQPYHTGISCEEYAARRTRRNSELSIHTWMQETGAKQCPTCKMIVTKQNLKSQATQRAECHKMICRNCNTRFCFKCLTILTNTHRCNCTHKDHGFIDPKTGKVIVHKIVEKSAKSKAKPKKKATATV